jgi:pyruvate-formate lyase-activating enzyme
MSREMTRQSAPGPARPRFGPGVTIPALAGEEPSRNAPPGAFPEQPFHHLDALWVQVAGTLCNLACTHCFVSCGPDEERHAMMSRAEVRGRVAEALALGVKEIYLTGGEPFLHPEIEPILEDALALAPVSVLTNGTLFTARRVAWLAALSRRARFALELRVSLDGTDAATHDAFRGPGAWLRTLAGLRALSDAGLLPIVTVTSPAGADPRALTERCVAMLAAEGVRVPRVKLLPMFRLGREVARSGGGATHETLATLPREAFDPHRLQCGTCRAVSSRGVHVCPLLVDEPGGRMADTLAASARPYPLAHSACVTCWVTGMTCANG